MPELCIGAYTLQEFLDKAEGKHGYPAPGLVLGGLMVEKAKKLLPEGALFEAIVETPKCLPDAVHILTLCSRGNGRLHIVNLGRFGVALYDKYTGEGVRVWVDARKLEAWPAIRAWMLKTTPKSLQDSEKLIEEICRAQEAVLSWSAVTVDKQRVATQHMGAIALCPLCDEPYPAQDGGVCRGCAGEAPYLGDEHATDDAPFLKAVNVEEAVGQHALHDMTEITPEAKGPAILAGQRIEPNSMERLRSMGKSHVYVADGTEPGPEWAHENEAALAMAKAMAGEGVTCSDQPREGKITFFAARNGLLVVELDKLLAFNLAPDVMVATRQSYLVVEKERAFAGCRTIPLYIRRERLNAALAVLAGEPLFQVLPLRPLRACVLVTGAELYEGRIQDRFIPIISAKLEHLGASVLRTDIVPDAREAISAAVTRMREAGAELIVTTAGLSVDPDDVTRSGLLDAGLSEMVYGAPILPGSMLLLGKIGQTRVIGVPACGLHHKTTGFDLLLPRVLAGVEIGRRDLARMAEGGFCLNCKACTYPKCPFGK